MELFHRIYKFHSLLSSRRQPVSRARLEAELEATRSTVLRVVRILRDYGAPIEYDRDRNGYSYRSDVAFELPGIWFSHGEMFALVTAHDLLASAEPSLLRESLLPLRRKLEQLMANENLGGGQLPKRVRILRSHGRGPGTCFERVAQALLERRQLYFVYQARTDGRTSDRLVSPQRLTHYRDNWYLDAWCHDRKGLRSFALERISDARVRKGKARDIADAALDEHYKSGYGIFGGKAREMATIAFSAHSAQWVAEERWHSAQRGTYLPDGRYCLEVPYSDERELLMDVLKYGEQAEVLAPPQLRALARRRLEAALSAYATAPNAAPGKGAGGGGD